MPSKENRGIHIDKLRDLWFIYRAECVCVRGGKLFEVSLAGRKHTFSQSFFFSLQTHNLLFSLQATVPGPHHGLLPESHNTAEANADCEKSCWAITGEFASDCEPINKLTWVINNNNNKCSKEKENRNWEGIDSIV